MRFSVVGFSSLGISLPDGYGVNVVEGRKPLHLVGESWVRFFEPLARVRGLDADEYHNNDRN